MTTFTYIIEISADERIWMMEYDDATGTEETPLTAEQFARVVLNNRLDDIASETDIDGNPIQFGYMRVSVWEGPNIGDTTDTDAQEFAESDPQGHEPAPAPVCPRSAGWPHGPTTTRPTRRT